MAGGAFQTSRDIFTNPIWQDISKFRIFFYIVGNATFTDGVRVGNITLERGQFLRSFRNLQSDLEYLENRAVKKYSLSVIKKKIDQLVNEERLKIEDTELGTLFTVVNYAMYQGFEHYKTVTENAERTQREQRENGVRTEKERSENNNNNVNKVKKEKKVKKDISKRHYAEFVSMSEDEYKKLIAEFGEQGSKERIERLNLYKGSTGKKYASDYLTILSWERKNNQNKGYQPKKEKSIFEQGEESKRRQAQPYVPGEDTGISDDELPF